MFQPWHRTGSAVNRMDIKSLMHNCIVKKSFSFEEKKIFDSATLFCGAILFFNTLIQSDWSII